MRVCILTETFYPVVGGGETQTRLLAEGLIAGGHSAMVLTRRSGKSLTKTEKLGLLEVHRLPPAGEGQLKKWGLLLSSFPFLIRNRREFDLIFVSGFRIVGVAAVLAGMLFKKSCVLKADSQGEMSGEFFIHGLKKLGIPYTGLLFRSFLRIRNRVLRNASAFSAISPDFADEFIAAGITPHRIHMVPNCVDTDRFYPIDPAGKDRLREKLGIPRTSKVVIYTGRLVSYKGLPILLIAWKQICSRHENALLLLIGSGGLDIHNCETELKEYVEANQLGEYVRFTGDIQTVSEYLQASDIFVLPTENDAFPSSLIEAMACRLPIITTPVGAIKTIVSDGVNGKVVHPGDAQQLADTLDILLGNPELCAKLGMAAWETVQEYYSADIVTKKYIDLFQQVLDR